MSHTPLHNYWAALRAKRGQKIGGRLVCAGKRQNGGRIWLPVTLPDVVANLLIFEGQGGSFQTTIMVVEQKQYPCVKLGKIDQRIKSLV